MNYRNCFEKSNKFRHRFGNWTNKTWQLFDLIIYSFTYTNSDLYSESERVRERERERERAICNSLLLSCVLTLEPWTSLYDRRLVYTLSIQGRAFNGPNIRFLIFSLCIVRKKGDQFCLRRFAILISRKRAVSSK